MSNSLTQEQGLEQSQQLKLTSRQIAYMRLLEMPVEQLKTRIENELLDNGALEIDHDQYDAERAADAHHDDAVTGDDDFYARDERADWTDAMRDYASEDDIPSYLLSAPRGSEEERQTMDDPNTTTFHDQMQEQVAGALISDDDRPIVEYLVGSLDDDGLLKKPLYVIADELEVYHDTHTSVEHLEELLLQVIQRFDPPGIGARSLQECLLIQARRRHYDTLADIIEKRWPRLISNRWDEIKRIHHLSQAEVDAVRQQVKRLNPRPGNAMSEDMNRSAMHVNPDFYVEVDDNGRATVSLNREEIPPLRVSETFRSTLQMLAEPEEKLSRPQREALNYARVKISAAQNFIDNLRGRQNTMLSVMQAIVDTQRDYFATGDERRLRPMSMRELSNRLGFDISAISRVCSSKWVDTPYGLHELKWYFRQSGGVVDDKGKAASQTLIKEALKALIGDEDKREPLTDDELTARLGAQGYPVARRTVAKYREQLGVPVARLRKTRL